jgi:hypothetical protein
MRSYLVYQTLNIIFSVATMEGALKMCPCNFVVNEYESTTLIIPIIACFYLELWSLMSYSKVQFFLLEVQ